jgi:tRNA U34 5-carboxymethylaminomethyl modifying GTPase MnmE/TrmE
MASARAFQKMMRPLMSAETIASLVECVTAAKRSSAARSPSSACLRAVTSLPET